MDRDYLQEALAHFNQGKPQWYGWRKTDDSGAVIPNDQRMKYEHIILNDATAILPSKAEVDAKIQEIKDADIVPEYVKLRLTEYPNHNDCIHALLDGGDTLTDLQAKRTAVKDKYPKP